MNTDKIFAEAIANEYAPKDTSKVVALRKLDHKAKLPAEIFFNYGRRNVPLYESDWIWNDGFYDSWHYHWNYWFSTYGYQLSDLQENARKRQAEICI